MLKACPESVCKQQEEKEEEVEGWKCRPEDMANLRPIN